MKKLTTALVATIQVATYDLLQVYDTKLPSRNVVAVGRGSRSDTWTQLEAIVVSSFFDAVVVVVVAERGFLEALTDEALVSALGSKITFEHDFQLGSLET